MFKAAVVVFSCAVLSLPAATPAQISDTTPYYMCFAYTQDGLYFAGGDFSFERAQKMLAMNCNMPKRLTVVLLKTLMVRKDGKTRAYALR